MLIYEYGLLLSLLNINSAAKVQTVRRPTEARCSWRHLVTGSGVERMTQGEAGDTSDGSNSGEIQSGVTMYWELGLTWHGQ